MPTLSAAGMAMAAQSPPACREIRGTRKPSIVQRVINLFWFLVTWSLLITTVAAVLCGLYLYNRADEEIRSHVESLLARQYPSLEVSVRSARLLELEGFEIANVALGEPAASVPLAIAGEVMVRCNPRLEELLRGRIEVRELIARRVVIRCARHADGTWSIRHLAKFPTLGGKSIPIIRLENSTVEIIDESQKPPRHYSLRDINAVVTPLGTPADPDSPASELVLRVEASLSGDHLRRTTIRGTINPRAGSWEFAGDKVRLDISSALRDALPTNLGSHLEGLGDLTARSHCGFELSYDPDRQPALQYVIAGTIQDGRFSDSRLPFPLTDLTARFECNNASTTVEEIRGLYGAAKFDCSIQRLRGDLPTTVSGKVIDLEIDESLVLRLPEKIQSSWQNFRPIGRVDAQFHLQITNDHWLPSIEFVCKDVSLLWHQFPYPVHHNRGRVSIRPQELAVDLEGVAASAAVRIAAHIRDPGADWHGWTEIISQGTVPIDETLLSAGTETMQSLVRPFAPYGNLSFATRFERPTANAPLIRSADVQLVGCSIRHEAFPYPLHNVHGQLVLRNENWQFNQIHGFNDSGEIICNGSWDSHRDGGRLELTFQGTNIPIENELRDALDPTAAQMWDQLRPRGTIDHATASFQLAPSIDHQALTVRLEKWHRSEVENSDSLSITPVAFPYRIDGLSGAVTIRDGRVQMENMRGHHNDVRLIAGGHATTATDGSWTLAFDDLTVDRLRLDREFLAAAPPRLSEALASLDLSGPAGMEGSLVLSYDAKVTDDVVTRWNLDIDVEDATLGNGFELTNISGGMQSTGVADSKSVSSRGELNIDSLLWRGKQLTSVRGPLWFDGSRILLGAWALPRDPNAKQPSRRLTAKAHGGLLQCDAQMMLDEEGGFETRMDLTGADLAAILRDYGNPLGAIDGKAHSFLTLSGTRQGTHTWRGQGGIRLRETNLYELPFVLSLLRTLRTGSTDRSAFDEADIDFRLQGEHAYLDHIDLRGDALTLKGIGELSRNRDININFYTVMGREDSYVAAVRPLLGMASRRMLVVKVRGPLDHPEMTREVLPGLNESLQQLFPETPLTPTEAAVAEEGSRPASAPSLTPDPAIQRAGWWSPR